MQSITGRLAAVLGALLFAAALSLGAAAQEFKQIELTDAHIKNFLEAQADFAPLAGKLLEGGDKPDEALLAQLEEIAKKHGFKNFAEYEDVGANITIVLDGLDRKSGVYSDPVEKMKKELEEIKSDTTIPEEDRKLAIEDLTQEIATAQPLQYRENIEVVKRHVAEISKLIPDEGPDAGGPDDQGNGEPPAAAPEADKK